MGRGSEDGNARPEAIGTVDSAWLFTRGDDSVRLVRVALKGGRFRLLILGPGVVRRVEEVPDVMTCAMQQAELERRLVAEGFRLEALRSDRRGTADGRPPDGDRRHSEP